MSSVKEKDEYNVISDNNEYAVESNGEEIIYEEYIDADQILEGYTEDGELVYYTEDGVYEEIILGDDSDVMYEEIVYGDEKPEKTDDDVFVENEKESENVILGDGSDEENIVKKEEKKSGSKKSENNDLKKKSKDKVVKNNNSSEKDKNLKSDNDNKESSKKKIENDKEVIDAVTNKNIDIKVKNEQSSSDNIFVNDNNNSNNINNSVVNTNAVVSTTDVQNNGTPVNSNVNDINNKQVNNAQANNNDVNTNAVAPTIGVQNNGTPANSNINDINNKQVNNAQANNNAVNNDTVAPTIGVQNNGTPTNSNVNNASFGNNNQNNSANKSVFTKEEKDALVSDENARLANSGGQQVVGNNMSVSKGVPVVQINLEDSKSSLNPNNSVFSGAGYVANSAQVVSNGVYQMSGQINNSNMMPQPAMVYQNQMMQGQNQMVPAMHPMNNYMAGSQGNVAQPQIINSQPMQYQSPVMTQPYQPVIPVATSGVVPPSNMQYQAGTHQVMHPVNPQMMYQTNAGVYGAQGVQQMGAAVYPNNGIPQVPRVNPYQAMKPATQTNKSTNSNDKSIYKKNHGFLKFLFLLFFLAIVGFFVYVIFLRESNYNGKANLNSLYDPLKLIPVYEGESLGYTNYNGEFVLEPQYTTGSDFYGNFAVVSKNEKYEIINKDGESVIQVQGSDIPFYDNYFDVWIVNNSLYDNEMNLLFSNIKDVSNGFYSYIDSSKSEVGIVDNNGKIIYSCSGTTISFETSNTFFNDSYALVKVDGNDDVIISSSTKEIVYKSLGVNIKGNNIFSVNFNGVTKYIYVFDGKVVKEFDNVSDVSMFNFSKKILQVTNFDGSNYFYDTINNSELTTAEAGELFYAEEYYGYELVKMESDSGVKYDLKKNGESVLDMTYDSISFLEPELHEFVKVRTLKEFVILTSGDTVKLYDLTFKKVFVELQNVDVSYGGTFVTFTAKKDSSNKEDTIYNLLTDMEAKFTTGEKEYIIGSNYVIAVDKNNNASYYNIKVKNIHETSKFPR